MKDNNEILFKPLVGFAIGFSAAKMNSDERQSLRLLLLDYYAALAAGYRINRSLNEPLMNLFMYMGGKEESTVVCGNCKIPAANAALLNGSFCRAEIAK